MFKIVFYNIFPTPPSTFYKIFMNFPAENGFSIQGLGPVANDRHGFGLEYLTLQAISQYMTKQPSLHYWKTLPDRDEVLELIYAFIRALHDKNPKQAESFVMVNDMAFFQKVLDESLRAYLNMVIEDQEWDDYLERNLAFEVDDPLVLDEVLMQPEFSGRQFVLSPNETISLQIGMREQVTPIRLHFILLETDELYYIKIQRITSK